MFEERLMAAGRFDLNLRPGTPYSVRGRLTEWGLLVVTPRRLDGVPTAAQVLARSRFTGVVRVLDDDLHHIEGASAAILAGDEDDKGHTLGGDVLLGQPFADIVDTLCGYMNGFTRGRTKNVTGTAFFGVFEGVGQTARKYLEYIRDNPGTAAFGSWGALIWGPFAGLEYRFNHDLTFDVDDGHNLFAVTPQVLLTDAAGTYTPTPGGLTVIGADMRVTTADVEDWISGATIIDTDSTERGDADLPSNPYKNPAGGDLQMRRAIFQSQGDSEADLDVAASVVVSNESRVVQGIEVDTDIDLRRHVQPGDNIYVHHPAGRFVDPDNMVLVHGRTIHPKLQRVFAMRYALPPGSGVYHLTPTDPMQVVDLSEHSEPETAPTQLEVGFIYKGTGSLNPAPPWFPPSL